MKVTFVDVDRDTLYLLSPSIQNWLPEKHLARFVVEIVEQINLQPLKASYCAVDHSRTTRRCWWLPDVNYICALATITLVHVDS